MKRVPIHLCCDNAIRSLLGNLTLHAVTRNKVRTAKGVLHNNQERVSKWYTVIYCLGKKMFFNFVHLLQLSDKTRNKNN